MLASRAANLVDLAAVTCLRVDLYMMLASVGPRHRRRASNISGRLGIECVAASDG